MSDFKELKPPKEGNDGWYIPTLTDSVAWLSINGDVTSDVSDTSIFYHDSELEAHEAASKYYHSHSRIYAHAGVLNVLRRQSPALKNVNESQVVVFE